MTARTERRSADADDDRTGGGRKGMTREALA